MTLPRAIALTLLITGCQGTTTVTSPLPADSKTADSKTEDTSRQRTDVAPGSLASAEDELWTRLLRAEQLYVVLLRHAIAPGTGDPPGFRLEDCSTQRNLSAEGQQQAVEIGEAFRSRGVAAAQVLSSQWCRCLDTARLLNLGEVQPFPALNSFFDDRSTANAQTAAVKQLIAEQQARRDRPPGVLVLVTHQVNISALSSIVPASGEAVVMQMEGDRLNLVGRLQPSGG